MIVAEKRFVGESDWNTDMTKLAAKMEFRVNAQRLDSHGGLAQCKETSITLDTDLAGRSDAFNPAELLLAALGACMLKGIERVVPILKFELRGVRVELHAIRQDLPPRLESIDYEIFVDSDESDPRLELLHENVKRYGTVFNTIAPGTQLSGRVARALAERGVAMSRGEIRERT